MENNEHDVEFDEDEVGISVESIVTPQIAPPDRIVAICNLLPTRSSYQKDYEFWTNIPLQEGDIVVVDTVNGLDLVTVVGIKRRSTKANRWVIQKVDLTEYHLRIQTEKRMQELQHQMDLRVRQTDKLTKYRAVAEQDPLMAVYLKEYEALNEQKAILPVWEG